jgi:hypothetical protein
MSDTMYDIPQDQYPAVIREMIRHEDDVTNHRIMWLLVGEGFIANAYILVKSEGASTRSTLEIAGMLVALSAFLMLYRSYQARGYLQFLGHRAKQGSLREENLPLVGWPRNRINHWRRNDWLCPWFRQTHDLFEPWLLLPFLFTTLWMIGLLRARSTLHPAVILILGTILSAGMLSISSMVLVWLQGRDDSDTES